VTQQSAVPYRDLAVDSSIDGPPRLALDRVLRRSAALFALGAVAGSALDALHTHSGATSYPAPIALRMAWWTPLLFGGAVLSLGVAYVAGLASLGARRPVARGPVLALACAVFVALYAASGFLPASNATKLALLVTGAGALWALTDRTWQGALLALGVAAAGVGTEVFLTGIGAFTHHQADLLGVPIWLPGLYLASAPSLGQLARKMLA
jgi:hypothetical protein